MKNERLNFKEAQKGRDGFALLRGIVAELALAGRLWGGLFAVPTLVEA